MAIERITPPASAEEASSGLGALASLDRRRRGRRASRGCTPSIIRSSSATAIRSCATARTPRTRCRPRWPPPCARCRASGGISPLRPWLFRVAHNESISLLRTPPADGGAAATTAARLGPTAEAALEERDRLRQLVVDLRSLPERQSAALVMRELSGLSYAEIAAALSTSEAAARQTVYEGRIALRTREEGREMECETVRHAISDRDGRRLRGRALRAHLADCDGCHGLRRLDRPSSLRPRRPLPADPGARSRRGLQRRARRGIGRRGRRGRRRLGGIGHRRCRRQRWRRGLAGRQGRGARRRGRDRGRRRGHRRRDRPRASLRRRRPGQRNDRSSSTRGRRTGQDAELTERGRRYSPGRGASRKGAGQGRSAVRAVRGPAARATRPVAVARSPASRRRLRVSREARPRRASQVTRPVSPGHRPASRSRLRVRPGPLRASPNRRPGRREPRPVKPAPLPASPAAPRGSRSRLPDRRSRRRPLLPSRPRIEQWERHSARCTRARPTATRRSRT